jgi:rhodanese-related sulfurtransferase
MNNLKTITVNELEQLIGKKGVEVWNVLTDEYYKGINIAGTTRVPLDTVGREVASRKLAKDTEIVTYCAGPKCPQSHQAAEKLTTLGFTNVRVFEGGIEEWEKAGKKLDQVVAA